MITIDHLTKRYRNITAVDGLSFEVGPGRVTGFLGPNGAGKTTTLRMLLGLARPDGGTAAIDGARHRDLPHPARTVGAALDNDTFHPGRSAIEHLRVAATAAGISRRRPAQVLGVVGLCADRHRRVAYDDCGRVVVDLVRYAGAYDVSTLTGPGPLTLHRWIIDPAAGKVTQQRLDDRPQEFPRTDERVAGQPHRYGYGVVIDALGHATISPGSNFADEAFSNALLKHDLTAGTVQAHELGPDATAREAVFAPAAPGAAEDEGNVMAFIHNPDRGAADLVVLAAQDFTAGPIAGVHLPTRIRSASTAAGSPTSR